MSAFSNIIGYKDIKEQLYQVIDVFKNEDVYKNMGAFIPSGILIVGDPGLGKTTLAMSFIKECGVESFVVKNNQENSDLLISQIKDAFVRLVNLKSPLFFLMILISLMIQKKLRFLVVFKLVLMILKIKVY